MPSFIQPSFASGELSPSLFARVDTSMYAIGLRTAYNAIIHPYGGISNRPGSIFLAPVKDHSYAPRLIPFVFGTDDQYVLEFGNQYMRVIRNDAHVLEGNVATVTGVDTSVVPVRITATNVFSDGDEVQFSSVGGTTQLNGNRYIIRDVTASAFSLYDQVDGSPVDGTAWTAFTTGGTVDAVYTITTPYLSTDVMSLNYAQSANTMTLVHPDYAPRDLVRTGHAAWTLSLIDFTSTQAAPTAVTSNFTVGTAKVHRYAVTATGSDESFAGTTSTTSTPESATAADPVVVTDTAHGWENGDLILITGFSEMTELNNRRFTVANKTTNTYELLGEDGTTYTAESSGGTATGCFVKLGQKAITGITQANPAVVTTSEAHGFGNGDVILITGVFGMTEVANRYFKLANVAATTFELTDPDTNANINSTAYTAYSSGGNARQTSISWTAAAGADLYSVYKEDNGLYGWIGETKDTSFEDRNIDPDLTISLPVQYNPFPNSSKWPSAVAYYEQRLVFGGTDDGPDTLFFSQTGNRKNFATAIPAGADDSIEVTLAANEVNVIEHFVPGSDLMVFTSGSEWRVNSGDNQGFSASTIKLKPQSYWGSAQHRPLRVNQEALFVDESNARIRAISYDFVSDSLKGSNLTLLADHLFADIAPDKYVVTDWAWSNFPEPRLYVVRSDGLMCTMTYDPEQKVLAWTRWETEGKYERVLTLRRAVNSVEDGIFTVVKRTINGRTVRYIERQHTRKFADAREAFFLDAGSEADGRIAISSITENADGSFTLITDTAHGLSDGDDVQLTDIVLAETADGVSIDDPCSTRTFTAYATTANTLKLSTKDGYTAGSQSAGVPRLASTDDLSVALTVNSGYRNQGFFLSPDGTKMFFADSAGGTGTGTIRRYDLSTPHDISTAVESSDTYTCGITGNSCEGVHFSNDGTKMFIAWADISDPEFRGYSLSTAWDITTAPAVSSPDLGSYEEASMADFTDWAWHPDGTSFTVVYGPGAVFYHVTLVGAWNLTGASLADTYDYQTDVSDTVYIDGIAGMTWNYGDGTYMLLNQSGSAGNFVELQWPTAYDTSSGRPTVTATGNLASQNGQHVWWTGWGSVVGSGGVGKLITSDTNDYRFKQATVDVTEEVTNEVVTVPDCVPNAASICSCVSTVTGLEHLEGQTIKLLVDGRVTEKTVSNGAVTVGDGFDGCACIISTGIPYCTDIETLNIEAPQGTIQNKLKKMTNVMIRFFKSRLPQVGPDRENLTAMKQRSDEKWGDPAYLLSGDRVVNITPQWNSNGRVFIRQCEPVPLTILAVNPDIEISDQTSAGVVSQSNIGTRRA